MDIVELVVVQDEDDVECAEVLVDGSVAGRRYRFVLDTGAARTHVVSDEFTRTFPVIGEIGSTSVFGATQDVVIELPDVTVGPFVRSPAPAVRYPDGQPGARNLLGMDVLSHHCCHFRLAAGLLEVGGQAYGPTTADLLTDEVDHPYVTVELLGVTAQTVWDTGAGITVIDQTFFTRHPELFVADVSSRGTDAGGVERETQTYRMAESWIGGHLFAPCPVAVVDLAHANASLRYPMDMILGYPILAQADWLFDFPSRRWTITRSGARPA